MNGNSRRKFLKESAAALSAMGLPTAAAAAQRQASMPRLSPDILRAVAEVVLPSRELQAEGIARVLAQFDEWIAGFQPVAELEHPYLSSPEVRYGLPHPQPRWQAQLEALDIEAQKEHGAGFARLAAGDRRRMIERQVRAENADRLPAAPAEAAHFVIGLLAFFYSTPEANDLCYEAEIKRWGCRGLETGPQKPGPIGKRG